MEKCTLSKHTKITLTVHKYSKIHSSSSHPLHLPALSETRAALGRMLEVQIISPVQQVDHDKREGEGDSGVVVYVVGVLHPTAVQGAEHFADGGQSGEAPVGALRGRRLWLGLAARGAGRDEF